MEVDDIDYDPPPRKQSLRCVCGTDLPGTCPGPMNCPYSDTMSEEDEDDEDAPES